MKAILKTSFVEINDVNSHLHFTLAFFTITTMASHLEYLAFLVKLALRSLYTSSFTAKDSLTLRLLIF